jgi:hypothetical protein
MIWARRFADGLSSLRDRAAARLAGSRFNPSRWRLVRDEMPPLHNQVLVSLKGGPGFVADVACYIGKQDDGTGKQIDRWILADVRLETRQISHWKPITEPV